ncbi:MAG: hypothetical protein C0401_10925 [Anaerolinea sp.]|nr:hypothetical protein [Anaerolinea sp.]
MINRPSPKKSKTWLNLSEAADILGVHFATLRRWADAGDIECMRTPGGRRRFKTEVVIQFLQHHQQTPVSNFPTVIENRPINYTRRDLQTLSSNTEPWMLQFSDEQKLQFRQTGSRFCSVDAIFQPDGKWVSLFGRRQTTLRRLWSFVLSSRSSCYPYNPGVLVFSTVNFRCSP